MEDLRVAAGVLDAVLRDEQTAALFGEPVDAVALGLDDYFDVVKHPADLGSIKTDVRASLGGNGPLSNLQQVADAVGRVWANCLLYNNRPEDKPIRDAAARSKQLLERAWVGAGLSKEALSPSQAAKPESQGASNPTPAAEASTAEAQEPRTTALPVKRITNFSFLDSSSRSPVRLEALPTSSGPRCLLVGTLVADDGAPGESAEVPVLDWVLDHGADGDASESIWALADDGWYSMVRPSDAYEATWQGTGVAARLVALAKSRLGGGTRLEDLTAAVDAAVNALQTEGGPRAKRKLQISREVRTFAANQLRAGIRAALRAAARAKAAGSRKRKLADADRQGRRAGVDGRAGPPDAPLTYEEELALISDDDMPSDFVASDAEDAAGRRAAWRKTKHERRREAAEAAEAEACALRALAERERDLARGAPPAPTSSFRLAAELVPDLLSLWDFAQTFGDALGVPPFTLTGLEAALDPGPQLPARTAAPDAKKESGPTAAQNASPQAATPAPTHQESVKKEEPTEGAAAMEVDAPSASPAAEAPSPAPPAAQDASAAAAQAQARASITAHAEMLQRKYGIPFESLARLSPIDWASAPAALLTRDLACALLAACEPGALLYPRGEQPTTASVVQAGPEHAVTWPERVASAVVGSEAASAEAQAAAWKLAYRDWPDLTARERLTLLIALRDLALASSPLQAEVAERLEALTLASGRVDGAAGDEDGSGDAVPEAEPSAAGPRPARVGVDDWVAWRAARRLGLRRSLGTDARGRRYWALGGGVGAFRLFVEWPCAHETDEAATEEDRRPREWGWYEGSAIDALRAWLEAGDIGVEADVREALESAPWPRDQLRPGQLAGTVELVGLRPDGYRGLVAPLLRGEWEGPRVGLHLPPEARLLQALDALLAAIPFWFRNEALQRQHLAISEVLSAGGAVGPREAGMAAAEAERLLSSEGATDEEWRDVWQVLWRHGLSMASDVREVLMHVAAVQRHFCAPDVVPRPVFEQLMLEANCHLILPKLGDSVVLLRTGVLMHIDRYADQLGLTLPETASAKTDDQALPDAPPEAPARYPLKADEVAGVTADWAGLRAKVAALDPVGRYTVRSIAFRRHLVEDGRCAEPAQAGRCPVAWLFLRPAKFGPPWQLPGQDLIVPLAADPTLPDYLVPQGAYLEHMRIAWLPGDRFRLHPTSIKARAQRRAKSGILTQRGSVVDLTCAHPAASATTEERRAHDPFRSVIVLWDRAGEGEEAALSPWDLEVDPEDERRRVDEGRRTQQAAARALRARAARGAEGASAEAEDAEEARLRALMRQGTRAEELLRAYESKPAPGPEDGTFNEEVFGWQRSAGQNAPLQALMLPLYYPQYGYAQGSAAAQQQQLAAMNFAALQASAAAHAAAQAAQAAQAAPASAGAAPSPAPEGERIATLTHPTGPLRPGQEIKAEVLAALKPLSSDEFMTLLTNFYRGLRGKYKVPTFAHRDLDLPAVFWAVTARGGYETVTTGKQWKEICRCLDVDLTGQTSASYNMRLNYERCLLDFENYLACGKYEEDVAVGTAPVHTHLTDPGTHRFTLPGIGAGPREGPEPGTDSGVAAAASTGKAAATAATTQRPQRVQPPRAAAAGVQPLTAMLLRSPGEREGSAAPAPAPAPAASLGAALARAGAGAVGTKVERFWPDEGGWWAAEITDYDAETDEHQLTYNRGREDETFEWADLAELSDAELHLLEEGARPKPKPAKVMLKLPPSDS